jgi:polar amino acid transport system substrate-binding protein
MWLKNTPTSPLVMTWALAGLLALAPCGGAAQAQAGAPDAPPLTLTISTNNTPLDRQALAELTREALRRIGADLKLVNLPSERSLHEADAGAVDGEGLRVAGLGAQYPNLVQVPERYIGISFVAFAKVAPGQAAPRLEQGWRSLAPYSVAHIGGWKLFEASVTGTRVLHKVDKPEQLFRMLDAGRIDLALYTRADGLALLRSLGLDGIQVLEPALKDVDMYLYLHRRHAALVPRLAQALRDMKADGSHARILAALKAG